MSLRTSLIIVALALAAGCDRNGSSPAPMPSPASDSSQQAAAATQGDTPIAPAKVKGHQEHLVNMQDACDPETFNAVLGAGTCLRSGGVRFENFIALLTKHGSVGAWLFAPKTVKVREGETMVAVNRGGEEHTFTEVAEFGGGIVPDLNELAHVPTVAPECAALDPDDFVAPGGTYREEIDGAGPVKKFQCCIHPWMKLETQVSEP